MITTLAHLSLTIVANSSSDALIRLTIPLGIATRQSRLVKEQEWCPWRDLNPHTFR